MNASDKVYEPQIALYWVHKTESFSSKIFLSNPNFKK